jgi:hypothetical protein
LAENVDKATICTIELETSKVKQFSDAIESTYWFEFFIGTLHLSILILSLNNYKLKKLVSSVADLKFYTILWIMDMFFWTDAQMTFLYGVHRC